jgi:hypothetical protein
MFVINQIAKVKNQIISLIAISIITIIKNSKLLFLIILKEIIIAKSYFLMI